MAFNYPILVEKSLLKLVKNILQGVEKSGLNGDNHFYITFKTKHPRVKVPQFLKDKHPEQITIVLQYEFDTLRVNETEFGVRLRFNQKHHYVRIPFEAVTHFADPSEKFELHFDLPDMKNFEEVEPLVPELPYDDDDKIISLDYFRRKEEE